MGEQAQSPQELPNTTPPITPGSGQSRLVIEALQIPLGDIKQDIKDIRGYRLTDLLLVGGGIIASFVLLASMMIAGYFRLEDKIQIISTAQTRIETKLEDLLARIPPMQTPPRR